jgi:hypothetical protein
MKTNWKRCSKCHDLKQLNEFWDQGTYKRSWCKTCITESIDKNKKREYDKNRYENYKIKKIVNKVDHVCMRCEKKYANVRNNQLYWCFDCLSKYEKENKQVIKIEVIDVRRRNYNLLWNDYKDIELNGKTIEGFLYDFINGLENRKIIDSVAKENILNIANLNGKEDIIKRLVNEIELFLDYEENSDDLLVDFPYKKYLNELTST